MKRLAVLLLALLLCVCSAQAEGQDRASVRSSAGLFAAPQEDAQMLMEYIAGVRVEVIREAGAEYVQVNVGEEGGSLMGYMKKEDLVFGEENIRQNFGIQAYYGWLDWTMYSYCDEQSEIISEHNDAYVYIMGENEEWIHAKQWFGSEVTTGFVKKDGTHKVEDGFNATYESSVDTELLPGEVTQEEAIEYAKQRLIEDGVMANAQDGVAVTREMLDSCQVSAQVRYYDTQDLICSVTFIYSDRTWEDGFPMICAFVEMWVEGDQIVRYGYGNG